MKDETVGDMGEFKLIDKVSRPPSSDDVLIGIGDDAAAIKAKGLQLLTTDCLVEDVHFNTWFTPEQVGMKAIEQNVSDIAAMGGVPMHALVSLTLPKETRVSWVKKLYSGMLKRCRENGIDIIGGNMAGAKEIMISVTMTGNVTDRNIVRRGTARHGDMIFISGYTGGAYAGMRLLEKRHAGMDDIKRQFLEPRSDILTSRKIRRHATAMADTSDGLLSDLSHICRSSRCGAILYRQKIPISPSVRRAAYLLEEDPLDYALFGGEDFRLIYTMPKERAGKAKGFLIGEITKRKGIRLSFEGREKEIFGGYSHFQK